MIKHLITGGCSFSFGKDVDGWTAHLTKFLKEKNANLTYEHTGYLSQGQELIQKKVTLAILEALEKGLKPEEILVVVMWSGTSRKSWYIDNDYIIQGIINNFPKFHGGMCDQFLDLKNQIDKNSIGTFNTQNGSKFNYNKNGGWYFTVDGSDCQLDFVKDYYLFDKHPIGIGKVHLSLENIIMLQNFCELKGIMLIQQFFMDFVYQDIESNKYDQIISYLYKQLNFKNIITYGMFEYIHKYIGVARHDARFITHDQRKKLSENEDYFQSDGFHPGDFGAEKWCNEMLFPFLNERI